MCRIFILKLKNPIKHVLSKVMERKTVDSYCFIVVLASPHITSVQYCGGCSVLWGIASVHVGDSISAVEAVQYSGGKHQYCREIVSVLWRLFSTADG